VCQDPNFFFCFLFFVFFFKKKALTGGVVSRKEPTDREAKMSRRPHVLLALFVAVAALLVLVLVPVPTASGKSHPANLRAKQPRQPIVRRAGRAPATRPRPVAPARWATRASTATSATTTLR